MPAGSERTVKCQLNTHIMKRTDRGREGGREERRRRGGCINTYITVSLAEEKLDTKAIYLSYGGGPNLKRQSRHIAHTHTHACTQTHCMYTHTR